MKYDEYLNACLDFAKESKKWYDLDPRKPYISTTGDGWEESCDNANGGIDVSWAFHLDAKTIRDRAPQKFMDCCTDLLQCGLSDPSTEHDFIQSVYDLFT